MAGHYETCKDIISVIINDPNEDSDWLPKYPFYAGSVLILNHDRSEFDVMMERIKDAIAKNPNCNLNSRKSLSFLQANIGNVQQRISNSKDKEYLEEIITNQIAHLAAKATK